MYLSVAAPLISKSAKMSICLNSNLTWIIYTLKTLERALESGLILYTGANFIVSMNMVGRVIFLSVTGELSHPNLKDPQN
jgi:hypothetical protein